MRLDVGAVRIAPPGERSELATADAVADGVRLGPWLAGHRAEIDDLVDHHGALLMRGFDIDEQGLEPAIADTFGKLFEYSYRSTPRSTVVGRVYTSTEYPADQSIPLHNEMSYAANWPRRLWFLCVKPAPSGGATPIASSRAAWDRIPSRLRDRFERRGVEYRRRFGPHLDLSWQEAFQTNDRATVEAECRRQGMRYTWLDGARLVTSVVRPATILHPREGRVWFNQAHLFHTASLAPDVREALLKAVSEDALPRAAYYGDGTPIADDDIATIGAAYDAAATDIDWQAGDVLLVDNEATAHGRRPFRGLRRVVVAMSDPSDSPTSAGR